MATFSKEYGDLVDVILTHCDIYPPVPMKLGGNLPYPFSTEEAMWDTGSDVTVISPRVVQQLGLKTLGYEDVDGIGAQKGTKHYCHIGLPDGTILTEVEVVALPIAYDLIIGTFADGLK